MRRKPLCGTTLPRRLRADAHRRRTAARYAGVARGPRPAAAGGALQLTRPEPPVQSTSLPRRTPFVATTNRKSTAVSAPQDSHEASRLEKLHAIEALGLDPWGARFDDHQPI